MSRRAALALVLLVGCGGGGGSGDDDVVDAAPATPDANEVPPAGAISADLRVDHFGWRPGDRKVAVLLGHAGATVELRRAADGVTVATFTASGLTTDEDSGDQVATVDFSEVTAAADYYLYLPDDDVRSYRFTIGERAFDLAGLAAAKSYYFQRCNHDKALPFAGDALGPAPGRGASWVDGRCHAGDDAAPAGPGSADHGALDVHGGWHDAGDYQKTLWGRGVPELLFAYELNPGAWTDDQLDLPESGNGVPDLLDEIGWELDFYVRMQRPDGHFMTSVKGRDGTVVSPPSASDEGRVYFDATAPSGDGWSGGGTTIAEATGNAVLCLAHAAVVYAGVDDAAAARYGAAARAGWTWLAAASPGNAGERRLRAAAAAAMLRLDPTIATARTVAEGFAWSTWDGQLGGATPGEGVIAAGAWHYLMAAGGDAAVTTAIETGVAAVIVDGAFAEAGAYGGMFGGPGNGWDWSWGSNRAQSMYGANLMMAAHFGILGGHAEADVVDLAERHLHYMLGANPLSMVYLTNMAAYGGEHSSFHIYHAWFSYTGADGDHGNARYDGKPAGVDEPLYPYFTGDDQTSTDGPAPGIVPGGPNFYYSGGYELPSRTYPAYAYRDFSVGCDWDGATCQASSWEITEPSDSYQGPFVLLASFFMSR
ncbi:MAG: glycoside hydrolase family 9 protein [Kofleriaceae bacterium]|nr:glycoside hydrolase family 9 protein [Kofleriaceae bacterium]